jgi:Regulator of chromosome condensation (RCC1) repeat
MIKHVMRLVLVMSAISLLFACGGEKLELKPAARARASTSLSRALQCSDAATIVAGMYHTVGLKEDGTVVAVGDNGRGQLNVSSWTNIKAVAAGWYHTVGLKEDGTVVAVGYNNYGQLNVSSWTNIKAIAAGTYHTVGLKEDGTVVAVGYNNYGQLNVSSWTNIKAIAAGTYHTVGLKQDGTVVAVGYNNYGQLNVFTWANIKAIAAGANHTVGLNEDGTVAAVGDNSRGQLNVSSLFTNIMPLCGPVGVANQDITPPITTVMITGTQGNNGWYVSDVQITLTATDNDGGSGVKEIHYSVDGTETIVSGSSASHAIAGDGTHAVTWYAVDNAGNVEMPAHEMSINIDKTPPSIPSLVADPSILWPPNRKMVNVAIGGSVADGGSGIDSTIITVTDEYGICNMTVPGFGNAIALESWRAGMDMDGRLYTITAVITDKAGNQSTGTTTVLVPHDMR